eukprot:1484546-Pleurochrysis_carterae.AAC.1
MRATDADDQPQNSKCALCLATYVAAPPLFASFSASRKTTRLLRSPHCNLRLAIPPPHSILGNATLVSASAHDPMSLSRRETGTILLK